MAGFFPLIKMAVLFTTRIARPFNVLLMRISKRSPYFTQYVLIPPARAYHWCDSRMKIPTIGLNKPAAVTRLSDVDLTELGAAILSEALVFTIGTTFLVTEMYRQNLKNVAVLEKEEERKRQVESRIIALEELVSKQVMLIEDLNKKPQKDSKCRKGGKDVTATSTSSITKTFFRESDISAEKRLGLFKRMLEAIGNSI